MITINNLSMGFTQRTLFKDVTLSVFPKEKIGLAGPNGSGKSTLFHIIRGQLEPLSGDIQIQKNINVGYLPQESHFDSNLTVLEEITDGEGKIKALKKKKRKLEDTHQADSDRYGDILIELETLGIYDLEHRAEKVLMGLGFSESDFHSPVKELSGGWQMRTLLAKLLTFEYDLLLLDEPTNYLDLGATLWLKDFLRQYRGAFILISHDRVFLNEVTNYTIMLDGAKMFKVKGNYATYEQQKGIRNKTLEKRKKVVDKKRQQLERFAQRFHAQPNRASAVRNKRKMLERLEEIDLPQDHSSIGKFEFARVNPSGYVVLNLKQVSKSYGSKHVYKDLDFEVIRGQKICLVGTNGAGKSTLLKMIAGVVTPDSGEIKYGHQVERGYFSQSRLDVLHPDRSAFDEVASACASGIPALKIRTLLGLFNFQGDDVFKTVKVLSGGEKSRLILAKLLINPPNFMLLDEPTTHLDLDGVKALTEAFKVYDGTICFISHDLFFIKEVADCVVEVQQGQIKIFLGGLDYYLEKKDHDVAMFRQETRKKKVEKQEKGRECSKKKSDKKTSGDMDMIRQQHKQAKKRLTQIKNKLRNLEKQEKELEVESYVKARHMSKSFDKRDEKILKEYGQRLKEIQKVLREIESQRGELVEERTRISKGD